MRKSKYALAGPVRPKVPKVPMSSRLQVPANYIPILPKIHGTKEEAKTNRAIEALYQRQTPMYKQLRQSRQTKQTGGAIGGAAGATAAALIPGAQPFAPLLTTAGSFLGGLFDKKPEEPEPPATVGRVFQASYGFKRGGSIKIKPENKGKFTAFAKRKGMGVQQAARHVLANKDKYSPTIVKRANFARNAAKWKKATGGSLVVPPEIRTATVAGDGSDEMAPWRQSDTMHAAGDLVRKRYMAGGYVSPRYNMGGEVTNLVQNQEGVFIEGPSHEAGGVDLSPLGRPDVEVEGNEAVAMEQGEPEYVFSDIKMEGKNRTFAEEYERLLDKGDFKKIEQLKMDQERQMGRVTDVTVPKMIRKASFAKYGGKLKMQTGGDATLYAMPGPARPSPYWSGVPDPEFVTAGADRTATTQPGFGMGMDPIVPFHTMLPPSPYPYNPPQQQAKATRNPDGYYHHMGTMNWLPSPRQGTPGAPARPSAPNVMPSSVVDDSVNIPGSPAYQGTPYTMAPSSATPAPVEPGYQASPIGTRSVTAEGFEFPGVPARQFGAVEGVERPGMTPGRQGINWGRALDIAGQVAPYAADLYNIIAARRMPLPERPRAFTPALMDDRVSTVAQEADIQRGVRSITGDPTATQSQRLAAISQGFQARGGVRDQANQRRDQIRRSNVATINQGMLENLRTQERYEDRLAQARGARATATSQGIRSLSDRLAARRLEQQAADMEPMRLATAIVGAPSAVRADVLEAIRDTLPAGRYENIRRMVEKLLKEQPQTEAA
jgi:hypothetical protein